MARNQDSHFALNPTSINRPRSSFRRDSSLKTSFNVGQVVPIFVDEVLPGDTFQLKTSKVVRLQTLITPLMDNIYLDTYFFFVPNRIVWDHWQDFMGENRASAWTPQVTYSIPQLEAPSGGWNVGTIADYMGIPTGVSGLSVNALPFRAYARIIDEWFRNENLTNPLNIPTDDTTVTGVNSGTFTTDIAKGGLPFVANKFRDYFTSCLPAPQKGPDVVIPLGDEVPVFGNGSALGVTKSSSSAWDGSVLVNGAYSRDSNGKYFYDTSMGNDYGSQPPEPRPMPVGNLLSTPPYESSTPVVFMTKAVGVPTKDQIEDSSVDTDYGNTGLIADLSLASSVNINQLRMAFQIQKLYEKDARGGSRYVELLKSHFGVTSPDARLQRPEYLGGNRIPINISQVVQTSNTSSGNTPQGNVAGYSVTSDTHNDFTKSFVEHGYIIGVAVARYDHTYQQGIERFWSRTSRFDFYWPVLANIGEAAVLNKEIYADGSSADSEVFGYQEAWAEYRYKPSRVSGEMRSSYTTSLDAWHLGDDYASLPMLSDAWIHEDKTNVDRALAVTSSVSNQLFGDFFFSNKTTRCMPMYSIPGLIDHN